MAVRQLLDADRVVEIARVLAVDRHRDGLAEIGAARRCPSALTGPKLCASSMAASPCASGMPNFRMMISVSTPLLVDVAEHFDDLADRAAGRRRPRGDFHDDHLARLGFRRLPGRNMHVGHDASVERLHEPRPESSTSKRPTIVELPRSRMRMMRPSTPVLGRPALDAREHAVAMHRFLDVARPTGRHRAHRRRPCRE